MIAKALSNELYIHHYNLDSTKGNSHRWVTVYTKKVNNITCKIEITSECRGVTIFGKVFADNGIVNTEDIKTLTIMLNRQNAFIKELKAKLGELTNGKIVFN